MGVSLALRKLEQALRQNRLAKRPLRICTLGPIIHNPQALALYASQGAHCLESWEEIQPGDHVLIRAHGVTRQEERLVREKARILTDATCPRVKAAQLNILKSTTPVTCLLLFGEPEHPEVAGLVSYARGKTIVFQNLDEIFAARLDPSESYTLASQTTQDKMVFENISHELSSRFSDLTILQTICDATRQRQDETLNLASTVDCMVVVGGKQSGNTRRLAAIAGETGIPVFHVETAAELQKENFTNFRSIGLTAGASTPHYLIDEIEKYIQNL